MKKFTTVTLLAILIFTHNAFSQTSAWTALNSGITSNLLGVSAVDGNICYATGLNGVILKTSNGGSTWSTQISGTNQSLYSVCFTDLNNGIAVGDGTVLRTTNGGTSWSSISITTGALRNIWFLDSSTGFIVGGVSGAGYIFKTTDGGATWTSIPNPSATVNYSVRFTSALSGFICNSYGEIFMTVNGGTSWTAVSSGSSNNLFLMDFPSTSNGIIAGNNGTILRTADGGTTWTSISSGTTDLLCGNSFIDNNNGFVVGGNTGTNTGLILKTTDGGITWTSYNPGTSMLYRVDMVNQNVGYAVGFNGTILKYTSNVGINENESAAVELAAYPNPTNDLSSIDISGLNFSGSISLELYDLLGKLVRSEKFQNSSIISLKRNNLNTGIYFFNVRSKEKLLGKGKIIID